MDAMYPEPFGFFVSSRSSKPCDCRLTRGPVLIDTSTRLSVSAECEDGMLVVVLVLVLVVVVVLVLMLVIWFR